MYGMKPLRIVVWLVLWCCVVGVGAEDIRFVIQQYQPDMSQGLIYISKRDMTLTLADSTGRVVSVYPMACGRSIGPKTQRGDNCTPEGVFSLQQIQDAHTWGHDFHDGKGFIRHAYGPYFLRLKTGFSGIGIHGTHDPASIGTRATEGCIRLENSDVERLQKQVALGMTVIIGPEAGQQPVVPVEVHRPISLEEQQRTIAALEQQQAEQAVAEVEPQDEVVADNAPAEAVTVTTAAANPIAAATEEATVTEEAAAAEATAAVEEPTQEAANEADDVQVEYHYWTPEEIEALARGE